MTEINLVHSTVLNHNEDNQNENEVKSVHSDPTKNDPQPLISNKLQQGIIDPQDFTHLDIKQEPKKLEQPKRSAKKQAILTIFAIILFIIGIMVAPPAIVPGVYQLEINYDNFSQTFQITVEDGSTQQINSETIELITPIGEITYQRSYSVEPGTQIKVILQANQEIEDITVQQLKASITSLEEKDTKQISYTFYGRQLDDGRVEYSFKILTDTKIALGLMLVISFLWLSELIPLAASSLLIPVILVISKVQGATSALASFASPIIFLFLAGFLMAEAMGRTGLDKIISYRIFASIPSNAKLLLFVMMSLSAIFSMFMSNTAAVALLIPLALQLLKGVELEDQQYRKTMVLGIAYAATIGGIGSIIGTPPNIIATELLREFNPAYDISFVEWFMFGLPVVIIMLPLAFLYLWTRFKPKLNNEKLIKAQIQTKIIIKEELRFTKEQAIVSLIFILTLGLWLTTSIHNISSSIIALQAAVLLFMVGQIQESDLNIINWNALITFGGGLALGGLIIQTGLADYIGTFAIELAGLPTLIILFVISLLGLILTAFASNTASAVIMIPIVLPLGYILGISPIILAILVAIAASIDFAIVIGTPPTMMAYSTGIFEVKEIFQIGIILDIIGLFVISILSWLLFGYFAGLV